MNGIPIQKKNSDKSPEYKVTLDERNSNTKKKNSEKSLVTSGLEEAVGRTENAMATVELVWTGRVNGRGLFLPKNKPSPTTEGRAIGRLTNSLIQTHVAYVKLCKTYPSKSFRTALFR